MSKADKKKRVELADAFLDILLYAFSLVTIELANGISEAEIEQELDEYLEFEMWSAIPNDAKYLMPEKEVNFDLKEIPKLREYIESMALGVAAVTMSHKEEYYTSYERAFTIAADQSNAVYNAKDFNYAVASGKTEKTWLSMRDERVRESHWEVDGETIGITEYFIVGGEPMLYPHDISASIGNTAGCRCSVVYK